MKEITEILAPGIYAQYIDQARKEIPTNNYSGPEIQAMTMFKVIQYGRKMELGAFLIIGRALTEIQRKRLWSVHPDEGISSSQSAEDAMKHVGMNRTQASNILSLYQKVIPWLIDNGYNVVELWESRPVSALYEIASVAGAIATGQSPARADATERVQNILTDAGLPHQPEDLTLEQRIEAMDHLLDKTNGLPVAEIREFGVNKNAIKLNTTTLDSGTIYFSGEATREQWTALLRRVGNLIDIEE